MVRKWIIYILINRKEIEKTSKTKEELEQLKKEYAELTEKLKDLSEEELLEVAGGTLGHNMPKINPDEKYVMK